MIPFEMSTIKRYLVSLVYISCNDCIGGYYSHTLLVVEGSFGVRCRRIGILL